MNKCLIQRKIKIKFNRKTNQTGQFQINLKTCWNLNVFQKKKVLCQNYRMLKFLDKFLILLR